MIELPSAALSSSEIAKDADFFSFGTNDLTQTTLGLSRDDASKFSRRRRCVRGHRLETYSSRRFVAPQKGLRTLCSLFLQRGPAAQEWPR